MPLEVKQIAPFPSFEEHIRKGWVALVRMVFVWPIVYAIILMLRKRAAQLVLAELSNVLCNTFLLGEISTMAPMICFTFYSLS